MAEEKTVRQMIHEKVAVYHADAPEPKEIKYPTSSYQEAKEAGNVREMLRHEHEMLTKKKERQSVAARSKEYISTLSISEIRQRLVTSKKQGDTKKEHMDRLYNAELDMVTREMKSYGSFVVNELFLAQAKEAAMERLQKSPEYLEVKAAYDEALLEHRALSTAKEAYIEEHKDLIEAERERVRREEFLASGILEELGIVSTENEE